MLRVWGSMARPDELACMGRDWYFGGDLDYTAEVIIIISSGQKTSAASCYARGCSEESKWVL
jgi:hypothetical protein